MNTLRWFFTRILLPACLCFTVLCFTFTVILGTSDTRMKLPTINLGNLTQIFVFSLIFAASWQLFAIKKLPFWLTLILHFVVFLSDIAVVFFLIGGHYETPANALLLLTAVAIVYGIAAAVVLPIRLIRKKKENAAKPYQRQF